MAATPTPPNAAALTASAATAPAKGATDARDSATTVTLALKHPHGLRLRLHRMIKVQEATMGGSREIQVAQFTGEEVVVRGYSQPNSAVPQVATEGAFMLTHGVSRSFWEDWVEQNRDHPYLENGLLFAADSKNYARDKAKEREELKSGLEPLNPSKLPIAGIKSYDKSEA